MFFISLGWGIVSNSYAVESEAVLARDYLGTVLREINSATASLTVVQYIFNLNLNHKDSPTTQIARALVEAKKRGVNLEVILDQTVDFSENPSKGSWIQDKKNWEAFEYLKANDIPVFFDSPTVYTHSKMVIRDAESVLLGSTNWSDKSLNENMESNVLIRNKEVAEQFLRWVSTIEKQTLPQKDESSVSLPVAFIKNPAFLTRMIKMDDQGGFDLYLYLRKLANENRSFHFNLNYDEATLILNLKGNDQITYRSRITRVLNRLEKSYQLIHFEKEFGKDSRIHLNENLNGGVAAPAQASVEIPVDYWNFGWNRKLSLAGKVFYILSLHYSTLSPTKPEWSMSREQIAWSIHVSKDFIQQGSRDLKIANLLSVTHDTLNYRVKEPRRPNIYTLKPLYDPQILQKGLDELEMKHGKEKFMRAIKCAELVFAQNDLDAVQRFIQLEEEFGAEKVKRAYEILALKNVDNPKRTVGYFFNTIKALK